VLNRRNKRKKRTQGSREWEMQDMTNNSKILKLGHANWKNPEGEK